MPEVFLRFNPDKELEEIAIKLAKMLPEICAPALNVEGRDIHDGGVGENEIMVEIIETAYVVNTKDFRITIFAHNFDERIKNQNKRADQIRDGVTRFLADYDRNVNFCVVLNLVSMGYASI